MFFSVIVPVYKVEKYLPACVESVLGQTFGDFELVLVDDGSPDTCPALCDAYKEKDTRIKVVHKQNGGLASARIAGIKIAEGEYVFNLDADDAIETDTLECARKIILETGCDIVSFAYRWMKSGKTVSVTNDGIKEGLYKKAEMEKHIYPRLLMDEKMGHISYYLSGKAVRRTLLLPYQLGVNEKISLGEDLCCVVPLYLAAESVFVSKKEAYLYTVREDSLSKEFNTKQICRIEDVMCEIEKTDMRNIVDYDAQLCRYSCFMCFAILAAAAENDHFVCIDALKTLILNASHKDKIKRAVFRGISLKSRISIFLMKRNAYKTAFYFLYACKKIKSILKKG